MNQTVNIHRFFITAIILLLYSTVAISEQSDTLPAPPSVEEISPKQQNQEAKPKLKTITVYESSFFPGVRLCNKDEVDYRGRLRKVNCQDEKYINEVSTRKVNTYNSRPKTVVRDKIEPNGNIFRINFRRKATIVQDSTDN